MIAAFPNLLAQTQATSYEGAWPLAAAGIAFREKSHTLHGSLFSPRTATMHIRRHAMGVSDAEATVATSHFQMCLPNM